MHTNLVILAGGASSRMKKQVESEGLTTEEIAQANTRSKGLISVGTDNRPLIDYLLYNAKSAGYKNIYIIIGENDVLFKQYYGEKDRDNTFNGLNISYAIQYIPKGRVKPYGTADALLQAVEQYPELKKETYSVCNSDNLYSQEVLSVLRSNANNNAFISYARSALDFPQERISRFALVNMDESGYLINIVEKPKPEIIDSFRDSTGELRVSMNIFKFNGEQFYPYLKECPINIERDEKEIPSALINMINDYPKSVFGIPVSEHVPDLTAKSDILAVKEYLKKYYTTTLWK
ncbi:MAG: NTP transferase domain-containing protein [Flavobacteriaceae bacterium]|nr:NTP transferase domain-containing protein [Flavobacteriaceae bacterium]